VRCPLNPDEFEKYFKEYSKKYSLDRYSEEWKYVYDHDYELMMKKNYSWDISDDDYTPYSTAHEESTSRACTHTEEECAEVKARWTGALVKFATHITPDYRNPLHVSPREIDPSSLNVTGTVFETEVDYQDRSTVQVLWADAAITNEKIDDLVIVQPLPTA
jgi:hypothetical protein